MQSNNPVFRRSEEFNARTPTEPDVRRQRVRPPGLRPDRLHRPVHLGHGHARPARRCQAPVATGGPMTIDSVVQKTAISSRRRDPDRRRDLDPDARRRRRHHDRGPRRRSSRPLTIGSCGAFALSMVNSFKRVISPALVLAFARARGRRARRDQQGLRRSVPRRHRRSSAVIGTFGAFAGTLAAYKFFNIKVGRQVPHLRHRGRSSAWSASACSSWCSACSAPSSASSASAASACSSRSSAWCSASSC